MKIIPLGILRKIINISILKGAIAIPPQMTNYTVILVILASR